MSILAINASHHIGGSLAEPTLPVLAMRAPSFLPAVVFETHWLWWITAIALGAIFLFAARTRGNAKLLRAGQAILVISLVWMVLARSFETAGERLRAAHDDLAAATQRGDVTTIVNYMDPSFSVAVPQIAGGGDVGLTKENARDVLTGIFKELGLSEIHITAYEAALQPNNDAQSFIVVIAKTGMGPTKTAWRIHWVDVPGADWRMQSAVHVDQGNGSVTK